MCRCHTMMGFLRWGYMWVITCQWVFHSDNVRWCAKQFSLWPFFISPCLVTSHPFEGTSQPSGCCPTVSCLLAGYIYHKPKSYWSYKAVWLTKVMINYSNPKKKMLKSGPGKCGEENIIANPAFTLFRHLFWGLQKITRQICRWTTYVYRTL